MRNTTMCDPLVYVEGKMGRSVDRMPRVFVHAMYVCACSHVDSVRPFMHLKDGFEARALMNWIGHGDGGLVGCL